MPSHFLEMTNGVTDGIHSHMAHMQSPWWVRKHREDIKLLLVGTLEEKKEEEEAVIESWDMRQMTIKLTFNPEST